MRTTVGDLRTDSASRVINAPPGRLYRALMDPLALAAWLPPEGMRGEFISFDARVGGGYRMALVYDAPDHAASGKTTENADVVQVRFIALVEDEKIVQEVVFETDDATFAGTMTMTWALQERGSSTLVSIVCENVPVGISADDHDAGLTSSLANLARFVE